VPSRAGVTTDPSFGRHDGADALEGDLSILGLAVPDPPVQAIDFRDDRGPGVLPLRGVGRQGAGCLFSMLQPHGDVSGKEIALLRSPPLRAIL